MIGWGVNRRTFRVGQGRQRSLASYNITKCGYLTFNLVTLDGLQLAVTNGHKTLRIMLLSVKDQSILIPRLCLRLT